MQFSKLAVTLAMAVGLAQSQAITSAIAPSQAAPASCSSNYPNTFNIATINVTSASEKRDLEKRQSSGTLTLTLNGGVLKDQIGRTGYIASNTQFQFDAPPQAGAIYTAGFSVCSNGSLALGSSAIFYACYSGGFYNLYSTSWAPQCSPIYIQAVAGGASGQGGDGQPTAGSVLPSVSEKSEGQPGATSVASSLVSEKSEGQPGATSIASSLISEKSEGQPVGTTVGTIVTEGSDGQPALPTSAPSAPAITTSIPTFSVSVSSAPASSLVSEASEGQPRVTGGSNSTFTTGTPTASGGASSTSAPAVQTSAGAGQITYNMVGLAAGIVGAMAFL